MILDPSLLSSHTVEAQGSILQEAGHQNSKLSGRRTDLYPLWLISPESRPGCI